MRVVQASTFRCLELVKFRSSKADDWKTLFLLWLSQNLVMDLLWNARMCSHDYQILPAFRTVLELLERCGLCSVVYCLLQRYRLCYKLECRDYLYEYVL